MITDTLVVLAGGFAFSWEKALYGTDGHLRERVGSRSRVEGSGIFRTAIIITAKPDEVIHEIMCTMERGVTILTGKGAYTGEDRPVLYCVITRSEVNQMKEVIKTIDPDAFMVIGAAHEALGEGFQSLQ